MRSLSFAVGLGLVLALSVPVLGEESRIPLYQSVVISTPGSYVLTRDIAGAGGVAIDIRVGGVTIDLNGHVVTAASNFNAITIASGTSGTTIRNGRVAGGTGSYAISGVGAGNVTIEDVTVSAGWNGISISGTNLVFRRSSVRVENNAMYLSGTAVLLVDSNIWSGGGVGLNANGSESIRVEGNVVSATYEGLTVSASRTCSVVHNQVPRYSSAALTTSGRCDVIENVVGGTGGTGITINGDDSRIAGNSVSSVNTGISVAGKRNLIEANHVATASTAYQFTATSAENIYRSNTARNISTTPVSNSGTGNTDAGGNVF